MEWKVEIERVEEDEIPQRIRVVFEPIVESIYFYGEARVKNNRWVVFSEEIHKMEITLEQLQEKMRIVVEEMRTRLEEYRNLDKGFSVLKRVGYEKPTDD